MLVNLSPTLYIGLSWYERGKNADCCKDNFFLVLYSFNVHISYKLAFDSDNQKPSLVPRLFIRLVSSQLRHTASQKFNFIVIKCL